MTQAGFLAEKKARPASAAIVIAMHAAAIAALLLAKTEILPRREYTPITIKPVAPPPEPPPPMPPEPQRQQRETITRPPIPSPLPSPYRPPLDPPAPLPDLRGAPAGEDSGSTTQPQPQPQPQPRPAPVRIEARIVGGNLQPPYPPSEQTAEREGTVVIRVTIGTDGRVVAAERVRATSDAFYEATERHARARWRFRPATLDGRPVESRRTMTVQFELSG